MGVKNEFKWLANIVLSKFSQFSQKKWEEVEKESIINEFLPRGSAYE